MSSFPLTTSFHFINSILSKYNSSPEKLNLYKVNDLLKNRKTKYVSLFKDYLIYDDITEFLFLLFNSKTSRSYLLQHIPVDNSYSLSKCFIDFEITNIISKNKTRHNLLKNIHHRKPSPHPSINISKSIQDEPSSIELSFYDEYSKEILNLPFDKDSFSFYSFNSEKSSKTKKTNSNTDVTSNNSKENEDDNKRGSKAKILSIFTIADLIQPTSVFNYNRNSKLNENKSTMCSLINKTSSKSKPKKISNISIINSNIDNKVKSKNKNIKVEKRLSNPLRVKRTLTVTSQTKESKPNKANKMLLLSPLNHDSGNHIRNYFNLALTTNTNNKVASSNKLNKKNKVTKSKSSEKKFNLSINTSISSNTKCLSMRTNSYMKTISNRSKEDSKINTSMGKARTSKVKIKKKNIIPDYCFIPLKAMSNRNNSKHIFNV